MEPTLQAELTKTATLSPPTVQSTEKTPQGEEIEINVVNEPVIDYGLRPGMTVEVLTVKNRLTFMGRVESYKNGAVIIREANGDTLPMVLYNKEIKLRFFFNRKNLVLNGKICGSTKYIWKVDRLESAFSKEQRAFFRQRISLKTPALCARRSSAGVEAKRAAPCELLDISAGGLLLTSREEYQEGNRLSITGVYLVEKEEPFAFRCLVRRVGEEPEEDGSTRYGCQYESIAPREQDRLLSAIFTLQREEIRRQKEREGLL